MRLLVVRSADTPPPVTLSVLIANGLTFDSFETLADATEALLSVSYDGMLLARRLVDGCGATWLAKQRAKGLGLPAIVTTGDGDIDDRIKVLDSGADDCVSRGINGRELLARVRAVLRRPPAVANAVMEVGNVKLDRTCRQVWVRGQSLAVPRREMQLLEHLMSRESRVVPRTLLEDNLYGLSDDVSGNSIEVRISRIRRTLAEAGATIVIRTVRGVGYMIEPLPQDMPAMNDRVDALYFG